MASLFTIADPKISPNEGGIITPKPIGISSQLVLELTLEMSPEEKNVYWITMRMLNPDLFIFNKRGEKYLFSRTLMNSGIIKSGKFQVKNLTENLLQCRIEIMVQQKSDNSIRKCEVYVFLN
jgi:hypothetical protein